LEGIEEKEKIYGKNTPVIGQSFASNEMAPGDQWKIYLLGSDPDGDMETILAAVEQSGTEPFLPQHICLLRSALR